MINLLSEETIDKIAAGEVVERPSSVVKELCENSIDSGATVISVEIKEGGVSLIRVTDNGCGIAKDEIRKAFLRHATSKITDIDDLLKLSSLGFRGEALSSISAVARVELITKRKEDIFASRYEINGNLNGDIQEIGAPDGTTFIARDLFYNTPVRRKFLKSSATEGSYVAEVMEHLALSHPEIAFTFINGNRTMLQTSGRGDLKEVIYKIYGIDMTRELLEISQPGISGFAARPVLSRSNRSFEIFFVNGRYVKSKLLSKAVEEAYSSFMMQHRFPFVVLNLTLAGSDVDANVHPTKMEVRFSDNHKVFEYVKSVIYDVLNNKELIPEVSLNENLNKNYVPEVETKSEKNKSEEIVSGEVKSEEEKTEEIKTEEITEQKLNGQKSNSDDFERTSFENPLDIIYNLAGMSSSNSKKYRPAMPFESARLVKESAGYDTMLQNNEELSEVLNAKQMDLFEDKLMSEAARKQFRIVGQVFNTYWIVEYNEKMLLIDQHAAHEKVLYEKFSKQIAAAEIYSQMLMPPVVLSLNAREASVLEEYMDIFSEMGYEIESFGGNDYTLSAVPETLSFIEPKEVLMEVVSELLNDNSKKGKSELVKDRIATMSCKAAVKGNNRLSVQEIETLLDELLTLDNPYNCPHGRPTMITLSKYELEKKFKRIV